MSIDYETYEVVTGAADVDASKVRLLSWNDATQDWYG